MDSSAWRSVGGKPGLEQDMPAKRLVGGGRGGDRCDPGGRRKVQEG